jgi:hypothetical protein
MTSVNPVIDSAQPDFLRVTLFIWGTKECFLRVTLFIWGITDFFCIHPKNEPPALHQLNWRSSHQD